MAAPCVEVEEIVYAAISNIPLEFHSKDLRNYFSQFLEVGGFDCFHFKHRPERKIPENLCENEAESGTAGDVTQVAASSTSTEHGEHANKSFDEQNEDAFPRQPMGDIRHSKVKKNTSETSDAGKHEKQTVFTTTCCVVRLWESEMKNLITMYRRKNWIGCDGSMMSQLCHICRVRVIADVGTDETESEAPLKATIFHGKGNHLESAVIGGSILRSVLLKLPELNPPDIMPSGNVGTPTSVFNQLIRECRLPSKVINRLGIVFPKSRTNKRYGNVAFSYGGNVFSPFEQEKEEVLTGGGHMIFQTGARRQPKKMKNKAVKQKIMSRKNRNTLSPPAVKEDDDSGEEWDRHEALHNDVTNQERTTERLFESEMEVTWDKGSSGLVFYTDAAYWDKQEGDFDEKTTDDWDVDMSVYSDPNGGDKDARDFIQMRRQQQMLQGLDCTRAFQTKKERRRERSLEKKWRNRQEKREREAKKDKDRGLGDFEKHTKGFGRKLMESQGWVDGGGLGKTTQGINEALRSEGQSSYDKTGFGYFGKKLSGKAKKKSKQQHSGERQVIISTIYDDPKVNDPVEPLLRSQGPYHLKYRDEVKFTKASVTDTKCH